MLRIFLPLSIMLLSAAAANAEFSGLTRVGANMNRPAYAVSAPGDPDRIFVMTTPGHFHIIDTVTRTVLPDLFLDLTQEKQGGGEGGVLGMAFHPDYETNGKFYVYLTVPNDVILPNGQPSPFSSQVREYTVSENPNVANTTYREIITWVQPTMVHNAGWIDFNPALTSGQPQYLYIASGDGGVMSNAQDVDTNLMGKMLRIDVDGDDFPTDETRNYAIPGDNPFVNEMGLDEIWSYGLRNPWRASFDSATGDLWIGDVGAARREEINFQAHHSSGGENYGWSRVEGSLPRSGVALPGDTLPVYEYAHAGQSSNPDLEGNAVLGGYVYRGPDADEYGKYFFGDNVADVIWSFDPNDPYGTVVRRDDLMADIGSVNDMVSFGSDAYGHLYIMDFQGEVFRFEPGSLRGDYNNDGVVNLADYTVWRDHLGMPAGALTNDPTGEPIGRAQYDAWVETFGTSLGSAISSKVVPEPNSLLLLSIVLPFTAIRVRGRIDR